MNGLTCCHGLGANMTLLLTSRDIQMLESLSRAVRLYSVEQIERHWGKVAPTTADSLGRRLRQLQSGGWLRLHTVLARPLPPITTPLQVWFPGDPTPDIGSLSYQAKKRWKLAARGIRVVCASSKSTQAFSGKKARGIRQGFQLSHDLGTSAVYLLYLAQRPELAALWKGEGMIPEARRTGKVPDAVIASTSDWPPDLFVEFAGAYNPERVQKFHGYCARHLIPYELW